MKGIDIFDNILSFVTIECTVHTEYKYFLDI